MVVDLNNIHVIFMQRLYIFSETILTVNIAKVVPYFIFGFGEMQNQVRSDAAESAYNHTAFVRIQFFIQRFILLIVKTAFLPIHTNQKRHHGTEARLILLVIFGFQLFQLRLNISHFAPPIVCSE